MKLFVFMTLTAFSAGVFAQTEGLQVGDKVPGFEAINDDGNPWKFKDHLGDKFMVVYFYPAAMTGGCTAQACAYRDLSADLASQNAMVVGVSGDKAEGLKLFKEAHNLNFTLLSDESGAIARLFGVPTREGGTITREINGQNYDLLRGNTASRWTFIIDKAGTVVYKNEQVSAAKDTEEVLSFLKGK